MQRREYQYRDIIAMLKDTAGGYALQEGPACNTVLTLTSNPDTEVVNAISLPFSDVHYGECVIVNALVLSETEKFGMSYCSITYFRAGKRVIYNTKNSEVCGGEYQFYGHGWKDYRYRFVIPEGVDSIEVSVFCKNGGCIQIKNLEVFICKEIPNIMTLGQGAKFVAHLGMIGYAPRNTMPAFYLAKRAGFRECVINMNDTSDGYIVALHNDTIDETSNGSGNVFDMTLAELRNYDFGGYFNEVYSCTEIPLLDDVLKFMSKSGIRPVLRLSSHFTGEKIGYLEKVYEMVKKNGLIGKCTAKGFSTTVLSELSKMAGDHLRYGYCCNGITQVDVDWIKSLGKDVYFDINYNALTEAHVKLALDNDIKVESWIINDFQRIVELIEMGVTGFTTDFYCLDGCLF